MYDWLLPLLPVYILITSMIRAGHFIFFSYLIMSKNKLESLARLIPHCDLIDDRIICDWHDYDGTDYTISVLDWVYIVTHTGATYESSDMYDIVEYVTGISSIVEEAQKKFDFCFEFDKKELIDSINSEESIREFFWGIEEENTEEDIIYYMQAMDYLRANDPWLTISLWLARDTWYSLEHLNSEVLASLLKTDDNRDRRAEMVDRIITQLQ